MIKIISDPTKTLDDLEGLLKTTEVQELTQELRFSYQIVLAGMTLRDIQYQEKALDEILVETGGKKVAAMSAPDMERYMFLYFVNLGFKNLNHIYTGSWTDSFAQRGTPDFARSYVEVARETKRKHIATGGIVDDGGDAAMGAITWQGGGGVCAIEEFIYYDPHDVKSRKAAKEYYADYGRIVREMRLGPGVGVPPLTPRLPKEKREQVFLAAAQPAIYHWQRKIKEAFDPNNIGDSSFLHFEEAEKGESKGK